MEEAKSNAAVTVYLCRVERRTRAESRLLGGASVGLTTTPATKGDIQEAMSLTNDLDARARLRDLEQMITDAETQKRGPAELRIVNINEIKSDAVRTVNRGEDGKLAGATVVYPH